MAHNVCSHFQFILQKKIYIYKLFNLREDARQQYINLFTNGAIFEKFINHYFSLK